MYDVDDDKLLREYGWDTHSKQYTVKIERKQYRPGKEPEKRMISYSNYGRMTVAEMRKVFAN